MKLRREAAQYHEAQRTARENLLDSGVPIDTVELADAARLAEGMIALSSRIPLSDPSFPAFALIADGLTRTGLANPDNNHWLARIRGDTTYRITGWRGNVADFSIQTFRTFIGSSQGVDELTDAQLTLDSEGRFEVRVSAEQQPGDWLRSDADTHWVLVRCVHDDWRERAGALHIEQIDPPPHPPDPVDSQRLRERLLEARENLLVSSAFWPSLSRGVLTQLPENVIEPPRRGVGNLANQWTSMSLVALSENEALVVSVRPTIAAYQGVQLGSVLFDYFDYENRQTSLSRAQSHRGSDGVLRYVVSARDPGVPNWIDTAGRQRGLLLFRWQGLDTLAAAEFPAGEVLPLERVLEVFPADVPRITPAERRAKLALRRRQLRQRFQAVEANAERLGWATVETGEAP